MKIQGVELDGPAVEIIPILRGEKEIIIKARAVLNYDAFHDMYPKPTPPEKMFPGGRKELNVEDPKFLKAIDDYSTAKYAWQILKSLEATEGLEWDTVDMGKPDTWQNYEKELSIWLSEAEIMRIMIGVSNAQGLNNDKIEEARKRFLASQVAESGK